VDIGGCSRGAAVRGDAWPRIFSFQFCKNAFQPIFLYRNKKNHFVCIVRLLSVNASFFKIVQISRGCPFLAPNLKNFVKITLIKGNE
jgi:hypothetical protein